MLILPITVLAGLIRRQVGLLPAKLSLWSLRVMKASRFLVGLSDCVLKQIIVKGCVHPIEGRRLVRRYWEIVIFHDVVMNVRGKLLLEFTPHLSEFDVSIMPRSLFSKLSIAGSCGGDFREKNPNVSL